MINVKQFFEKPEYKRIFGRPRHRWEDNIKIDLTEVIYEGLNWIYLAQDRVHWRVVKMVMNIRF
jgi:hypothetical protein